MAEAEGMRRIVNMLLIAILIGVVITGVIIFIPKLAKAFLGLGVDEEEGIKEQVSLFVKNYQSCLKQTANNCRCELDFNLQDNARLHLINIDDGIKLATVIEDKPEALEFLKGNIKPCVFIGRGDNPLGNARFIQARFIVIKENRIEVTPSALGEDENEYIFSGKFNLLKKDDKVCFFPDRKNRFLRDEQLFDLSKYNNIRLCSEIT